jgi:hypothetical protein
MSDESINTAGPAARAGRLAGHNGGESAVTLSGSARTGVRSPSGRDSKLDALKISLLDRSLE